MFGEIEKRKTPDYLCNKTSYRSAWANFYSVIVEYKEVIKQREQDMLRLFF